MAMTPFNGTADSIPAIVLDRCLSAEEVRAIHENWKAKYPNGVYQSGKCGEANCPCASKPTETTQPKECNRR